jgi:hypothetical protein
MLGAPGREVASALASTDTMQLDGHGFETDDQISFRVAEGGTLAAPLVAGTVYYAIRIDDSTFKVSATAGGGAINLTADGTSMIVAMALPIDDVIEAYSRWVDGFLPAHLVPLTAPVPVHVRMIVAELASKKLLQLAGHASASVNEAEIAAKAQLERWAKGLPLRDATATPSANKAVTQSLVGRAGDSRGWGSETLP